MLQNITKKIAHSGLCSRREAKQLVKDGHVKINGEVVCVPTTKVTLEDKITVNNKDLKSIDQPKIWLFHKPVGFITTNKDPQNRPTIFDLLPKDMPRVVSVGRLDMNSEGLLLLTNNGELARYFELPKNAIKRKYHVRVFGVIEMKKLAAIAGGCEIDGIKYGRIEVSMLKQGLSNSWIELTLEEGKNREIRKVLAHFGLKISRLKRVQYGEYELGDLKKGEVMQSIIHKEDYENYIREA